MPFKLGGGPLCELGGGDVAGGWGVRVWWRWRFVCWPVGEVVFVVARVGAAGGGVGCVGGCADVEEEMSRGHRAGSRDQDASTAAHGVQFVVSEGLDGWWCCVVVRVGVVARVLHERWGGVARGAGVGGVCGVFDRWCGVLCGGVGWDGVNDF